MEEEEEEEEEEKPQVKFTYTDMKIACFPVYCVVTVNTKQSAKKLIFVFFCHTLFLLSQTY